MKLLNILFKMLSNYQMVDFIEFQPIEKIKLDNFEDLILLSYCLIGIS